MMSELNLDHKIKLLLEDFVQSLKNIYQEELISIALYGSGASGEFASNRSNLNLLVVLKSTDPEILKKCLKLMNKIKFSQLETVFFTKEFLVSSSDVFPIEFLDIKENYRVLSGEDLLADLQVDLKNLRFQCEHELKVKLINLKKLFVLYFGNKTALQNLLFKSFTSTIHVARNLLRLKSIDPKYLKAETIKQLGQEFKINSEIWEKILSAKNKQIKLSSEQLKALFIDFIRDLEKLTSAVDTL